MKEAHKLLKMEAFEVYGGCGQESVVFQLIYEVRAGVFFTPQILVDNSTVICYAIFRW